jgi:hypothetical protein
VAGGPPREELERWVARLDPARAEVAAAGGPQRLSRTLEVALLSGRPLSWWHRHAPPEGAPVAVRVVLLQRARAELYRRIDERAEAMFRTGLLEEVETLLARGYTSSDPGMTGTGYREAAAVLRGELSQEEAVAEVQRVTRAYARRQLTWFRRQLTGDVRAIQADAPLPQQVAQVLAWWRGKPEGGAGWGGGWGAWRSRSRDGRVGAGPKGAHRTCAQDEGVAGGPGQVTRSATRGGKGAHGIEDTVRIGITCHPTYGGSGAVATELGLELAARGHEVHFISYEQPFRLVGFRERVYFHEVEMDQYPLFEHPPYSLALAVSIHEVAETHGLDLVHVHYAIPHAASAWIAREMLGGSPGPAIVTTLHGTDITWWGSTPPSRASPGSPSSAPTASPPCPGTSGTRPRRTSECRWSASR